MRLGRAMELQHKSETDLARSLGVSRSTIGNWKRGDSAIPATHLASLCTLLDITPDILIMGESFNPETLLSKEEVELLRYFRRYPERVRHKVIDWLETFSRNLR